MNDVRADLAAKLCGDMNIPDEVLLVIEQYARATAAAELDVAANLLMIASDVPVWVGITLHDRADALTKPPDGPVR